MKTVFEGQLDITFEDGGAAMIAELLDDEVDKMFIRLQSWDETHKHTLLKLFDTKIIRVTVETVEEL